MKEDKKNALSSGNNNFLIIPAIDIRGGRCVRLLQGDYSKEKVYSDDPIAQAVEWESKGAKFLHIVDLDGAKQGFPVNIQNIRKIVATINIPCEVGGGIRTFDDAKKYVDCGVSRVIFGTAAIKNPDIVERFSSLFPEKTVLGLDARDGKVAIEGWLEIQQYSAIEISAKFAKIGVKRFIYTDIATDGMLKGPNLSAISLLCEKIPEAKIIASGGVSSIEDILRLQALGKENLEGVIVGKALYEGKISLSEGIFS